MLISRGIFYQVHVLTDRILNLAIVKMLNLFFHSAEPRLGVV